jgi:hypothetical protein
MEVIKKIRNADKDVEKINPYLLLLGMQISVATVENRIEVIQKSENKTTTCFNFTTSKCISKKK